MTIKEKLKKGIEDIKLLFKDFEAEQTEATEEKTEQTEEKVELAEETEKSEITALKEVVEANAIGLWQSDTTSVNVNLNKYDGLIKLIDADSPISATSQASITEANVIAIFRNMVSLLPARLKKKRDLAFFCGWDTFESLLAAYLTLNNYHIDMSPSGPYTTGVFSLPLWGITVYAMHGLTDTDRIFLARESNLWIITDMEGEDENWDIWYERKDNDINARVEFKLGTAVTFGNEIVEYTNT